MNRIAGVITTFGALSLIIAALACAGTAKRTQSTSLVDFVYPDGEQRITEPSIPHLPLPLRVGVAFVPNSTPQGVGLGSFSEEEKMALMERVAAGFREHEFVKDIEIIPSVYLRRGGGFTNLGQLRRLYSIDVIALLSFDQVQFTNEDALSFSYWTIVGAYFIPGEKNDTHTLLDAAIFDIASRKLLFRAPGTSHIAGRATPVNLEGELKEDSARGFEEASDQLVLNLKAELAKFEEKVKESPEEYRVTHRPGFGGQSGPFLVVLALFAVATGRAQRSRSRS